MKSIVIFNNKGGVGKSTLLCNLASYLFHRKGKRIAVIDADPQCNATSYMFPYPEIEEIYSKSSGTIYDIIKPLKRGRGFIDNTLPIRTSPHFGIDVIVGDPQLSLTEDFLSKDWIDAKGGEFRGLQTTLVFKDLLSKLADYDYVFFDVGPSLGALNRSVLASCDFFIVPMSSDIFSIQALENISKTLKEWKLELDKGLENYFTKENEPFTINNNPVSWNLQFAGYVTQQYTAKTSGGLKQPVNAYEKIIKKISPAVSKYLLPINSKQLESPQIGEITNLHSLIPLSQNSSVPIFNLKKIDGVNGAHFNKVKEYEETLSSITEKLFNNLNMLS